MGVPDIGKGPFHRLFKVAAENIHTRDSIQTEHVVLMHLEACVCVCDHICI